MGVNPRLWSKIANWIFSKGSTHDFGQNQEILSCHVFGQVGLEILFDDH